MNDFQEKVKFTGGDWHLEHNEVKTWLVDSVPASKARLPSALADNTFLDLDYSGCHKNRI